MIRLYYLLLFTFILNGCVTLKKYNEKVSEIQYITDTLAVLTTNLRVKEREIEELKNEIAEIKSLKMQQEFDRVRKRLKS